MFQDIFYSASFDMDLATTFPCYLFDIILLWPSYLLAISLPSSWYHLVSPAFSLLSLCLFAISLPLCYLLVSLLSPCFLVISLLRKALAIFQFWPYRHFTSICYFFALSLLSPCYILTITLLSPCYLIEFTLLSHWVLFAISLLSSYYFVAISFLSCCYLVAISYNLNLVCTLLSPCYNLY